MVAGKEEKRRRNEAASTLLALGQTNPHKEGEGECESELDQQSRKT